MSKERNTDIIIEKDTTPEIFPFTLFLFIAILVNKGADIAVKDIVIGGLILWVLKIIIKETWNKLTTNNDIRGKSILLIIGSLIVSIIAIVIGGKYLDIIYYLLNESGVERYVYVYESLLRFIGIALSFGIHLYYCSRVLKFIGTEFISLYREDRLKYFLYTNIILGTIETARITFEYKLGMESINFIAPYVLCAYIIYIGWTIIYLVRK